MKNILPLIVCGTGGKVYDDVNNFKNLDSKSKLKYYSNRLGYGNIKATKQKLEIILLDESNKIEKKYQIKKNLNNSINMAYRRKDVEVELRQNVDVESVQKLELELYRVQDLELFTF